ncbi:replication protein [Citrobacter amalonaticus]|uniref:replication protein n=1 Tax=Citrobacter amalonaticus TaxID=35703 RepID=UPI001908E22C|nr:replication protein [Citrobacter amalonaticus]MBJ9257267.1 replication protein [Citrobacter amalonaticus]
MGNLAEVVQLRPQFAAVEHKVAELDDGYTRLSNTLLEAYAGADLTKRQYKVLLAILRKTYGWNKPMDRISDSQLSEIAKLPVKRCNEAKLELVRMGLVRQQGGMFGPNKNISEWCIPQNEGKSLKTGDKTSLKLRESHPSKQGDTKDTIQKKERKENTLSSCDDREPVKPARRKAVRINYEEYLEAYNEIVGDRLPHAVEANAERQRKLKKLIDSLATKNIDGYRAYVKAFMSAARPFHFGDNDRGWEATFDYLLQPKVLTAIREGTL